MPNTNSIPPPLPPPPPSLPGKAGRVSPRNRARFARWINLFCPGLGQILIGRWKSGLVFLFTFLFMAAVSMGLTLEEIIRIYMSVVRATSDVRQEIAQPNYMRIGWALAALVVAVLIQLWSVWDAGKESGGKRVP